MPAEARRCDACLTELVGAPKFCPECGAPVQAAAVRESRRTVTLLFTDVTGSTAMGETLDPEAYRGVMGRYFDAARQAVERHGGTVEKFVGDAVLAVFGLPEIREDDALRAVRAAVDLRHAMAVLGEELLETHGVRLLIRTGVNTGPVVTGDARAGGAFATGDAVNTAARLEQHADPGEVLIGAETYQLVRDAVEVQAVEPVAAKGKAEPVPAYRLLHVTPDAAGHARRFDAPLVGRERERRALDDALDRVLSHGRSHLVTVVGGPGMGKTRLVSDFVDAVHDRVAVARGRCLSYGHGITYWPIVQALRSAVGIGGSEPDEVVRKALLDAMDDAADSADVVALLVPVLGGGGEPGARDQTFWAVRRILEQLALRGPLLVTIDDLQWAEQTLLDLLHQIGDELADLPVLLVCQARPELLTEHPEWGRGSLNVLTFQLEPFGDAEVGSSLSALLGGAVPAGLVAEVARWSGGNPLFVEELVAHLRETGRLRPGPDGWIVDDLQDEAMPPTVSALLAARLDRLDAEPRDLLERISVIGLEFDAAEARALAAPGIDVTAPLAGLVRQDLLQRTRSVTGDTWAFRHLLIRDAAYASLPKALRAELHVRFADHLDGSASDAGAEQQAFIGHHLEQAAQLRRALAPHDPGLAELDERAALALEAAAEGAARRDDLVACQVLLRRAAALPVPAPRRRRLLMASLGGFFLQGSLADKAAVLDAFEDLLDDTATEVDRLFLAVERAKMALEASERAADLETAEELARQLLDAALTSGDDLARPAAHHALGLVAAMRSRWRDLVEHADAVASRRPSSRLYGAERAYTAAYLHGPFPLSKLRDFCTAALAEPGLNARFRGVQLLMVAVADAGLGEAPWATVLAEADSLLDSLQESELFADPLRAEVHHFAGDPATAAALNGRFVHAARAEGHESYASTYQAFRACQLLETHAPSAEIRIIVDEADAWSQEYDVSTMTLIHVARAVLTSRAGRTEESLELARTALEYAARSDALRHSADTRRWLHEVWHSAGDHAEERRQLELSLGEYQAKEAVVLARQTEALLAALTCS